MGLNGRKLGLVVWADARNTGNMKDFHEVQNAVVRMLRAGSQLGAFERMTCVALFRDDADSRDLKKFLERALHMDEVEADVTSVVGVELHVAINDAIKRLQAVGCTHVCVCPSDALELVVSKRISDIRNAFGKGLFQQVERITTVGVPRITRAMVAWEIDALQRVGWFESDLEMVKGVEPSRLKQLAGATA